MPKKHKTVELKVGDTVAIEGDLYAVRAGRNIFGERLVSLTKRVATRKRKP